MKNFFPALRRFIFADFGRKLLALLFAVLVYCAASERNSETFDLDGIPIEVKLPPGLLRTDSDPIKVSLKVRGNRRRVKEEEVTGRAVVQMKDFNEKKPYRLKLKPKYFNFPLGVHVTEITPSVVELKLQREITRQLHVKADFQGRLGADYTRQKVVCVPETVEVTGPESTFSDLKEVFTEKIPLDASVTENFTYKVKLQNQNGLRYNVKDGEVDVQVMIAKTFVTRRFTSLPVRLLIPPGTSPSKQSVQFETPMVEVEIKGLKSQVDKLKPDDVRPYVNFSRERAPGTYELKIDCFVNGDQVDVKKITPATIKVRISK